MNKVIVIVGPTGVGKTKLSIELAKYYKTEIINGDSVQIYKELNIGSAKVTEEEKENINHHLLDFKNIEEDYTIYEYQRDLRNTLKYFQDHSLTPIVVGGSGLYLKSALYDYSFSEQNELNESKYAKYSNEELYEMLKEKDEKEALKLHQNNRKRVIRDLLMMENSNENKTQMLEKQEHKPLYDVVFIGLTTDRETLYDRINKRVDLMIKEGLIEEAKTLYDKYENHNYKSLQAIGYKELFSYFNNEITKDDAIELIKKKSRNYAKRQYTWFNNQFNVNWFNVDFSNFNSTIKEVISFLEENNNE